MEFEVVYKVGIFANGRLFEHVEGIDHYPTDEEIGEYLSHYRDTFPAGTVVELQVLKLYRLKA